MNAADPLPDPPLPDKDEAGAGVAEADDGALSLERMISHLLRSGVVISVSLVALGTLVTFLHHPDYLTSAEALGRLTQPDDAPHALADVLTGVHGAHGQALVMMGLLLLISIPVTRVALSLLIFSHQKDRPFVAITAAVLAFLLLSFMLGQAGG